MFLLIFLLWCSVASLQACFRQYEDDCQMVPSYRTWLQSLPACTYPPMDNDARNSERFVVTRNREINDRFPTQVQETEGCVLGYSGTYSSYFRVSRYTSGCLKINSNECERPKTLEYYENPFDQHGIVVAGASCNDEKGEQVAFLSHEIDKNSRLANTSPVASANEVFTMGVSYKAFASAIEEAVQENSHVKVVFDIACSLSPYGNTTPRLVVNKGGTLCEIKNDIVHKRALAMIGVVQGQLELLKRKIVAKGGQVDTILRLHNVNCGSLNQAPMKGYACLTVAPDIAQSSFAIARFDDVHTLQDSSPLFATLSSQNTSRYDEKGARTFSQTNAKDIPKITVDVVMDESPYDRPMSGAH